MTELLQGLLTLQDAAEFLSSAATSGGSAGFLLRQLDNRGQATLWVLQVKGRCRTAVLRLVTGKVT